MNTRTLSILKPDAAGPVIVIVLEKENAVASFRELIGNTNPREAASRTIRCQFDHNKTRNAIHASDSNENAKKETDI